MGHVVGLEGDIGQMGLRQVDVEVRHAGPFQVLHEVEVEKHVLLPVHYKAKSRKKEMNVCAKM